MITALGWEKNPSSIPQREDVPLGITVRTDALNWIITWFNSIIRWKSCSGNLHDCVLYSHNDMCKASCWLNRHGN